MKNNNIRQLFLIIVGLLCISIPTEIMGMNARVTKQDLEQLLAQQISHERFDALKTITLADGSTIGSHWLSTSYDDYLKLKDWSLSHFVTVAQQAFDAQNPSIAQPVLAQNNNTTAPVEKITNIKTFFGSFFKTLLPWNTTNTQSAPIQDVDIKNEIKHDPFQPTEYALDIPGTLQTIKNKLLHHEKGMAVASYAFPAASTVVGHVGHHIEQNPLLYYSGGDTVPATTSAGTPEAAANTTETLTPQPLITDQTYLDHDYNWADWIDLPAWTGWAMKKTAQTTVGFAKYTQASSEIVAGKPTIDADETYETIRNEHKTKLRPQFKGTDEEFEAFFATHPTPVQGTALQNTKHASSLVDGMVAGLNDASKFSAAQAELLQNPTIRNAYATMRRINKSYAKPKSFKEALTILQAIDEVCYSSMTPEELFDVENKPDSYLAHLKYICKDILELLEQENITVGHIKKYAYRCKTILEVLRHYQNEDTNARKKLNYDLQDFIKSMQTLDNNIVADSLSKSSHTNTTIIEVMEIIAGETIKNITAAEKTRTHLFSDAITIVCTHIHAHGINNTHSTSTLSYANQRLYEDYINYNDHSDFERLWKNLSKRTITNPKLTEFLQNRVMHAMSEEQFRKTKLHVLQGYSLLGYTVSNTLEKLKQNPAIDKTLIDTLLQCCAIISNSYQDFQYSNATKITDAINALKAAITELEQYEHTHHTDVDSKELHDYRLSYDLAKQLNNAEHREQALQDLIGYYLILLRPLTTQNIGDYLIGLKTAQPHFDDEIPTPPAPPVLKDPEYISSFKKNNVSLIDKATDTLGNGAAYLTEHGPAAADNVAKRLNNAEDAAYRARFNGQQPAVAWVQTALTAPVDNQQPVPAPRMQPLPDAEPTVAHHNYDIKPEIQAWRTNRGKNPEEPASLVAHAWHGRQETYNDKTYTIAQALKSKIDIQNDQKTNSVIREEQFKYALNQPAEIIHPKPSYLSQFQDKYIEATVRLGYAGDILLLAGLSYALYKTYSASSFYQIKQLETVEKQCKHGMRNLVVGRSSFNLPALEIIVLTRLDTKQQATLEQAVTKAHDALQEAQSTLQDLQQPPNNFEELEPVKTADEAVSRVIALIKEYKKHITKERGYFDMLLSNSTKGLVTFMKAMTG